MVEKYGADALRVTPGQGIEKIVLTDLEVRSNDEHDAVICWGAKDLFVFAEATGQRIIPANGRLVSAGFEVTFTGQAKPRKIYLRAGNKLRLTRHSDAASVHRWLTAQGFRSPEEEVVNRIGTLRNERVERN